MLFCVLKQGFFKSFKYVVYLFFIAFVSVKSIYIWSEIVEVLVNPDFGIKQQTKIIIMKKLEEWQSFFN